MKIPIVNHKDYLAEINEDNKFPINKFDELAKYLIKKNYVNEFYKPYPCSLDTLSLAHAKDYIYSIKNKTLNKSAQKREASNPPVPALISTIAFLSSSSSLGSKKIFNLFSWVILFNSISLRSYFAISIISKSLFLS